MKYSPYIYIINRKKEMSNLQKLGQELTEKHLSVIPLMSGKDIVRTIQRIQYNISPLTENRQSVIEGLLAKFFLKRECEESIVKEVSEELFIIYNYTMGTEKERESVLQEAMVNVTLLSNTKKFRLAKKQK